MKSGVLPPLLKERVNTGLRINYSYIAIIGGSTNLESYLGTLLREKETVSRNISY